MLQQCDARGLVTGCMSFDAKRTADYHMPSGSACALRMEGRGGGAQPKAVACTDPACVHHSDLVAEARSGYTCCHVCGSEVEARGIYMQGNRKWPAVRPGGRPGLASPESGASHHPPPATHKACRPCPSSRVHQLCPCPSTQATPPCPQSFPALSILPPSLPTCAPRALPQEPQARSAQPPPTPRLITSFHGPTNQRSPLDARLDRAHQRQARAGDARPLARFGGAARARVRFRRHRPQRSHKDSGDQSGCSSRAAIRRSISSPTTCFKCSIRALRPLAAITASVQVRRAVVCLHL